MAEDVQARAQEYLDDLLGEELVVDASTKLSIAQWLSGQVLQERQGWKKKIQMSFKEVEKERKLALDVHARIHDINRKFQPYLYSLVLFREASMYHATDADSKVNHVDQLEKNLSALFDMIQCYQEERIQCFQYLQIADNTGNLTEVLRKRVSRLEDQIQRMETETKETETRLTKDIKNISETLDMQIKMNGEERDKNNKKTHEMQRTIAHLRAKLSGDTSPPKSPKLTPCHSSLAPGSIPVTPTFNVHRSVSNIDNRSFRDSSSQTAHTTRDCCIQVSLGLKDKHKSNLKSQSKEKLATRWQSQEKLNIAQDVDITDLKPLPLPGTAAYPIKAVTIVKKRNRTPRSIGDVIEANNTTNQRLADVSLSSFSDVNQSPNPDPRNAKTLRTVEFLRTQVTQLASKLEKSKQECERYQQQIANMRMRAIHREAHYKGKQDSPSSQHTHNPNPVEGKLTGIRVGQESPRFSYTQQNNSPKPKYHKPNFLHGMAKCLRCNKVYKLTENNQHACRYHPKTRMQIEKYDPQGRLVRVSHQWQCCLQSGEAAGCAQGEHV